MSVNDFVADLATTPRWLWIADASLAGLCAGSFMRVLVPSQRWGGPSLDGPVPTLSSLLAVVPINGEHMILPDVLSVRRVGAGLFTSWMG